MAPDISKVDTDRPLNPALSAWYFRDEVLRLVFHGNSLSPFRKTCSSHFSFLIRPDLPEPDFRGVWAAHFYGTGVIRTSGNLGLSANEMEGISSSRLSVV